jgi:hypothetical protein
VTILASGLISGQKRLIFEHNCEPWYRVEARLNDCLNATLFFKSGGGLTGWRE